MIVPSVYQALSYRGPFHCRWLNNEADGCSYDIIVRQTTGPNDEGAILEFAYPIVGAAKARIQDPSGLSSLMLSSSLLQIVH